MKTALLFDLDGTLLDTLQDLTNAVNHILAVYGCPQRTKTQIRSFLGNGAANLIAQSLPGEPEDPAVETVLKDYLAYYGAHDDAYSLFHLHHSGVYESDYHD